MTVSTQVSRNEFTGNGATTQYDFTFRIMDKSELFVQTLDTSENITTLTLDVDYSVTGVNRYPGGKVVLNTPLPDGYKISIERSVPVTQETSIRNQGGFFPEIHEDAFDKLTMIIQRMYGWWSGLALKKPSWLANYYDAQNNRIRNLRDPSQPQDAATKNYVDNQIIDNTNAWKEGDRVLDQKIDANFLRTLRVPESIIGLLPSIRGRRNKLLAFNDQGSPIAVLPESGSASDVLIELASSDGFKLIGAAESFEVLRTIPPEKEGQRIILASHGVGTFLGGGIFESVAGEETDDGGYICVPDGSPSWYWRRVLGTNEFLTPQMYGYQADYNSVTQAGTELKPYIQAAIDRSIAINKARVYLPDGDYYTAEGNIELAGTGHNRAVGVEVYGNRGAHTSGGTRIYFNAPALDTPLFVSKSPSSLYTMHGISDLWLEAVASNFYSGYAFQVIGSCHMVSERIHVERMREGIHLLNTRSLTTDGGAGDQNGYCEFVTFRDWNLNKCYNNVSFNNDGTGDPSMHAVAFINMKSQLKEDGNGIYFNGTHGGLLWYNSPGNTIKFWGGAATGTNTCQLIRVEGTEARGVGGGMTWEGFGRITCDANSYFRFDGDIFGLPGNKALIDYSGVSGENNLSDARVIFNNTTSRDTKNMSNTIMSPYYFRPIPPISRGAKNNTNYAVAMPIRITTSATEKPTLSTEYEGLAFPTNHNGDVWFGEVVSQSVWYGMVPTLKYGSSSGAFTNFTSGIIFNIQDASGNSLTNAGWVMGSNLYPLTTLVAGLGTSTNRLSSVYAGALQITNSGIFPRTTAMYDSGSATAAWNNIYSQNAVNVVSDSNLKPIQEDLSDAELEAAKACSKLFIKYKLAAAIAEKGDSARYHFGVVAQKVMAAFADSGLSADAYGVLVTSETKQVVVKNGENYEPIPDENGEVHIPSNDDGFIELIDSMDSLSIDDSGVTVLTRTTHLIRYDELLCFINAGIIKRLEAIEG